MYTSPNYTLTHLMVDYIVKAELGIARIKIMPLPQKYVADLLEQLHIEEIEQLSELLGENIGLYRAKLIKKGRLISTAKKEHRIYNNYRNALDYIREYDSTTSMPISVDLLLHLNKLLARGLLEDWDIGKLRSPDALPNEAFDNWYVLRDTQHHYDLHSYFSTLITYLNRPKTPEHRLIRLALLLYEFIDKAPLQSLNQITSALFMTIQLKEWNYSPHNMISVVRIFNHIDSDLKHAFKIAKRNNDITMFIEAFLYAFTLELLTVTSTYKALFMKKVHKQGKLHVIFNTRQLQILDYLESFGKITRQEYAKMTKVSFMTAFRDLKQLMKEGYIEAHGTGRGTYYTLNKAKSEDVEQLAQVNRLEEAR